MKKLPLLPTIVTAVVVLTVIVSLFLAGNPKTERQYRLDEQRVSNLETIRSSIIDQYYSSHTALPATLAEAGAIGQYSGNIFTDPETQTPYEYHPIVGTRQYSLCAVFDLPTDPKRQGYPTMNHASGRTCFDFTASTNPVGTPPPIPLKENTSQSETTPLK
jgi:hypothetical protein